MHVFGPWETCKKIFPKWAGCLFPTNQDLVNILGMTDFHSVMFFLFPLDSWISRFPDFQIHRFPDAAGAAGQTLRSQPDPSPNAPRARDQIYHTEPGALAAR